MSDILNKIKSAGSKDSYSAILSDSEFFGTSNRIKTEIPILNIAFSGSPTEGFASGLTIIAGESKTFKTMLGLFSMKAYMDKHPEGIVIFYDSEFGSTPDYLKSFNIDISRVIHIPIEHIEQLKFDLSKKLEAIERDDEVFIFIDSIGNLASKKEVEDAENEKSVADMTRAKALKSLFRVITPKLTIKDVPLFAISHVYKEMSLFPKTIVSGGSGGVYSANQILVITKAQEKDGTNLSGHKFTISIEKSRSVREKAKFPFYVYFKSGIKRYSGLLDIACDLGYIQKPTVQSYIIPKLFGDQKFKRKEIENSPEVWKKALEDDEFIQLVRNEYALSGIILSDNNVQEEEVEL